VHKIDTNISQLIDATIDNEFVFAEALNVVNKKVIDIENSIVPAVVDADYTPVTYPTIPDSQYTFNAVQPNNTLTQAVRKIDTNVSNLVEVIIDNEMIVAEAYNTVNTNLNAQINYFEGVTNVTSTTSIDIAKRLVICKMSVNDSFSLKETPIAGREIHVMVNNTGSSDIIISLPTAEPYVNLSEDSITIESGKWSEINVLSDGTNMFIRAL
jgi:hypothetical protein